MPFAERISERESELDSVAGSGDSVESGNVLVVPDGDGTVYLRNGSFRCCVCVGDWISFSKIR